MIYKSQKDVVSLSQNNKPSLLICKIIWVMQENEGLKKQCAFKNTTLIVPCCSLGESKKYNETLAGQTKS
jgi:hypothetical protein